VANFKTLVAQFEASQAQESAAKGAEETEQKSQSDREQLSAEMNEALVAIQTHTAQLLQAHAAQVGQAIASQPSAPKRRIARMKRANGGFEGVIEEIDAQGNVTQKPASTRREGDEIVATIN
jgi:hypothetical protein